jgi:hypothetical protein
MTQQGAQKLLRKIIEAKNKDELQKIISNNISICDAVFFSELENMVEQYRAKGDENSATKLKAAGDFMARLRFMI